CHCLILLSFLTRRSSDLEFDEVDADLKSAYHNLNFGTSYAEAVAKIGAEGTKGASSEANFGEISSESSVYTWMTDDMQVLSLARSEEHTSELQSRFDIV